MFLKSSVSTAQGYAKYKSCQLSLKSLVVGLKVAWLYHTFVTHSGNYIVALPRSLLSAVKSEDRVKTVLG